MDVIPPPEVRVVESTRIACDGDEGPLGHPRVWLQIGATGFADCGYCDRRFILAGGPADLEGKSVPDRLAPGATEPEIGSMSSS
jgi:NADH dehydrogenase (ubiquinone) Fe-S protein 6